jgi:SAM-dependent methyltransferase
MAPTTSSPTGWLSYDSVAATYEAAAVPWFTPLARDLVAALAPSPHEVILDVGTGTGLIARTITETEPRARLVGVDPSRAMLAVARATGHVAATAAMAPGLPFRDGACDAVVANLVISHLPDRHRGLTDLVRVLRDDGRLACSAWAAPPRRRPTTSTPLRTASWTRCEPSSASTPPRPSKPRRGKSGSMIPTIFAKPSATPGWQPSRFNDTNTTTRSPSRSSSLDGEAVTATCGTSPANSNGNTS